MPKKVDFNGSTVDISVWELRLKYAPIIYLVKRALKNDQDAKDILEALDIVLYDENNVQIWPEVTGNV